MLPARSQATSVGRLKLEPGMPDPGGRLAAATAAAAAAAGAAAAPRRRRAPGAPRVHPAAPRRRRLRRPHGDRFRLSAEHERDAPLGIELHDLVGRRVDRPDVVLRIDAQADRRVEAVDVLPELAHELAVRIELEQPRSAARERAVVAERRVGMAGARVDEDLSLRIRADAADFADEDVGRRLQQIGVGVERDLRNCRLRDERSAEREERRCHDEL